MRMTPTISFSTSTTVPCTAIAFYRETHSIHHRANNPFPLEFIYAHPLEWMLGSLGVVAGAGAAWALFAELSAAASIAGVVFRTLHELDIHSGRETRWYRWVPFIGTMRQHDDHHRLIEGNHASTFGIRDRVFGTKLKG